MGRLSEAYGYPDSPGWKEPTTSRDAAKVVDAEGLRALVMERLRVAPATADEVAAALGLSVLSIRPRVSELRKLNAIRPRLVGARMERRPNDSGAMATVWEENV